MEDESLKKQAEKVLEQLIAVKEEFLKNKDELEVSIRKDIVKAEIKAILSVATDYESLRDMIDAYINSLI